MQGGLLLFEGVPDGRLGEGPQGAVQNRCPKTDLVQIRGVIIPIIFGIGIELDQIENELVLELLY